jgi:4-hydroxy-3-methylbut-2-enyl diphosphate reductase
VQGVLEFLAAQGIATVETVTVIEERLVFALPPELRRDIKAAQTQ